VQSFPQLPQFCVLAFVSISQPSTMLRLQSSQSPAHAYWQLPSEHPTACVFVGGLASQSFVQLPQWSLSVLSSASQPLPPSPSQLPYPRSQLKLQTPPAQLGDALSGSGHTVVQLPHALMLLLVGVSHPSAGLLLQSPHPLVHVPIWHAPATQVPGAFAYIVVQFTPHSPQFVLLSSAASHPSDASPLQLPHPLWHDPISHPAAPQ
jgi:hypothetical protein